MSKKKTKNCPDWCEYHLGTGDGCHYGFEQRAPVEQIGSDQWTVAFIKEDGTGDRDDWPERDHYSVYINGQFISLDEARKLAAALVATAEQGEAVASGCPDASAKGS